MTLATFDYFRWEKWWGGLRSKVNGRDKTVIWVHDSEAWPLFWFKVTHLSERKSTILGTRAGLMKPLLSHGKAANRWFGNECWAGIESWCFIYRRLKAYANLTARKSCILWDCHWQEGTESCPWVNLSGGAGEKHSLLEPGLLAATIKN